MAREERSNEGKSNTSTTDRILAIPGISEASKLVRRYAIKGAAKDAWVRQFVRRLPSENANDFTLDDEMIDFELADDFLESLAKASGPKIAELWNLSENAGDKITESIYWGTFSRSESSLGSKDYLLPLVIVANMKNRQEIRQLSSEEYKLIRKIPELFHEKACCPIIYTSM